LTVESPLLNTVGEIELEASRIRFWMEDVLAGHQGYQADARHWSHLEQSIQYLESLARTKQLPALDATSAGDGELFKQIESLKSLLQTCKHILIKFESQQPRYSQPANLRAEMAGAFSDFSSTLSEIRGALSATIARGIFRFRPAGHKIWSGARYVDPDRFHECKAWWAGTGGALGAEDWAVSRAIRLSTFKSLSGGRSRPQRLRLLRQFGSGKTISRVFATVLQT
jgi:hypothetical protein